MPSSHPRILIIKPSSLGDVVHALPVLAAARRTHPNAHIAWLINDQFAPLLENHPLLDEVIRFRRRHYGRIWRSPAAFLDFCRFVLELRRKRFDLVLDLQGLIRSAGTAFLSGVPRRCGFADTREWSWLFYTQRVKCANRDAHAVDKNLELARATGLLTDPIEFPLVLRAEELALARRRIAEATNRPPQAFIALLPGARWESKLWPSDYIARLIDLMCDAGLPLVVLLGAPDERERADRIAAACRSETVNLVGKTSLRELAALIDLADCVVCHDSGPLHLAAALRKPTVALFGPTNPARTGPYSPLARVLTHPIECAPCYRRSCPYGHQCCLRDLTPQRVFKELLDLLASNAADLRAIPARKEIIR